MIRSCLLLVLSACGTDLSAPLDRASCDLRTTTTLPDDTLLGREVAAYDANELYVFYEEEDVQYGTHRVDDLERDAQGCVTSGTQTYTHATGGWSYVYDYSCDDRGYPTSGTVTYSNEFAGGEPTTTVTRFEYDLTYDDDDRVLEQVTRAYGDDDELRYTKTDEYTYDDEGRVLTYTTSYGDGAPEITEYTWYNDHHYQDLVQTYPDGTTVYTEHLEFDDEGRPVSKDTGTANPTGRRDSTLWEYAWFDGRNAISGSTVSSYTRRDDDSIQNYRVTGQGTVEDDGAKVWEERLIHWDGVYPNYSVDGNPTVDDQVDFTFDERWVCPNASNPSLARRMGNSTRRILAALRGPEAARDPKRP